MYLQDQTPCKLASDAVQRKYLISYNRGPVTTVFLADASFDHDHEVFLKEHTKLFIYIGKGNNTNGPGEIFQIGTGIETSINELIELLKYTKQQADSQRNWDVPVIYKPKRTGEIERNYSDITKVKTVLGFKPEVELERGLAELWTRYTGAV